VTASFSERGIGKAESGKQQREPSHTGKIMQLNKWGVLGLAGLLLVSYNLTQPGLLALRNNNTRIVDNVSGVTTNKREGYGASLDWLDRLAKSSSERGGQTVDKDGNIVGTGAVKLNFSVLSSLMVAGLASGFKSQVANLLWMKSDEYWHEGLFTRQIPLMEAVVTLDPQFIDAWSTAGWHWAYNIYADIPSNPDYKAKGDKAIRAAQDNAVATGIDYLDRGANANPDKYRLWFEWGWTRAEKGGYYDKETLAHYKEARRQSDARTIEVAGPAGQMVQKNGLDIMGRTIGHLLERMPHFHEALDHYAGDLMGLDPKTPEGVAKRHLLDLNGQYWSRYGSDYNVIGDVYNSGDAVTKAQVKKLVPDVELLIAAYKMRQTIAGQEGRDQPVGAYCSITARYLPAQLLADKGDLQGAINTITGVMNVDPKYHLHDLGTMAKIYELRGDAPAAIQGQLAAAKAFETGSSQDLGLHFLARLYDQACERAAKKGDTTGEKKFANLAYRTWYRSRERDALDFYALRESRRYEDKYNFSPPLDIIKQVKVSRQKGVPNAAPETAPSIQSY